MRAKLESLGITSENLDSMVDEAASDMATNANNGGMKSQLDFLTQAGFTDERIWVGVLIEQLCNGTPVDISEPKHEESKHKAPFKGIVQEVFDDYLTVSAEGGELFDIAFDEVKDFSLII